MKTKKIFLQLILILILFLPIFMTSNLEIFNRNSTDKTALDNNILIQQKQLVWSYTMGNGAENVDISTDGQYIVAGSLDDKVYLFDRSSSTPLWSYTTGDDVYWVSISANGQYIAAGSWDYKVYLFDRSSSTPLWSYTTGNYVYSVDISSDGQYIVAGGKDKKVYLFDRSSSTPLWSYTTGYFVYSVDISANGQYIAAGSGDKKVYLFDRSSSTPLWSYTTGSSVNSVDISANGQCIAAGSIDNKVYLFDRSSSTPLWSYTTGNYVYSVDISSDGQYIAAGSSDNKVYLFDRSSSTPLWSYTTGYIVYSVDISANGQYIVAGSLDNKTYLFNKFSSTPLSSYNTGYWVASVSISSDGQYIGVCSYDTKLYLFDNTILDSGTVNPSIGQPDLTNFTYRVTYINPGNSSPQYVKVYINGSAFTMQKEDYSDTDYTDGTIYNYTTTLPLGTYTYYFETQSSSSNAAVIRLPDTINFSGPLVLFSPILTNTQLSPDTGYLNLTDFVYQITYYDSNNDPPDLVRVNINGTFYDMIQEDPIDTDYTNGAIFNYTTQLSNISNYTYYFWANSTVPLESPFVTPTFDGPEVLPVIYNVKLNPDVIECTDTPYISFNITNQYPLSAGELLYSQNANFSDSTSLSLISLGGEAYRSQALPVFSYGNIVYYKIRITDGGSDIRQYNDSYIVSDITAPSIQSISTNPTKSSIGPASNVEVSVEILEVGCASGIDIVYLQYTIDNDPGTIQTLQMTTNDNITYIITIPKYPIDTKIDFIIYISDKAGNIKTSSIQSYTVIDVGVFVDIPILILYIMIIAGGLGTWAIGEVSYKKNTVSKRSRDILRYLGIAIIPIGVGIMAGIGLSPINLSGLTIGEFFQDLSISGPFIAGLAVAIPIVVIIGIVAFYYALKSKSSSNKIAKLKKF